MEKEWDLEYREREGAGWAEVRGYVDVSRRARRKRQPASTVFGGGGGRLLPRDPIRPKAIVV